MKKAISAVCVAIFIAVQTAFSAAAVSDDDLRCDSIFENNMQSRGAEGFFDGLEYGQNDWTAHCYLKTYGTAGAEEYATSALEYADKLMRAEGFVKPTDLQRVAITLSLFGQCSQQLINEAVYLNDDLDKQGINAYIWALIAHNCAGLPAPENAVNTEETLISYILSKQLPNGGFSLKGTKADTDITATALYALTPVSNNEDVAAAVSSVRETLISMQLESGGFSSMGIENCESTAQVIIALSADPTGLEWLVESGTIAALLEYRRADGGFSHLPDGETDGIATSQACMALTAYNCMKDRGEPLFGRASDAVPAPPAHGTAESAEETEPLSAESEANSTPEAQPETANKPSLSGDQIKLMIFIALVLVAAALVISFFIKRKKVLLAVGICCAAAAVGVLFLDIKSEGEYYSADSAEGEITVTLSAQCLSALDAESDLSVTLPEDGMILTESNIALPTGSTAFDALIAAAKEQQVRVDYTGTAYGTYVSGIGYLYEFDLGSTSGWLYSVNGEMPNASAGAYQLCDGDTVEFIYTRDLGSDAR